MNAMYELYQLYKLYVAWEQQAENRFATITLYSDQSGHFAWHGGEKLISWDNCSEGIVLLHPLAELSREKTLNFLATHLYCQVHGWFEGDRDGKEPINCSQCGYRGLAFFTSPLQPLCECSTQTKAPSSVEAESRNVNDPPHEVTEIERLSWSM